ncbi:hypothetical protein VaNZ11_007621 [Volvox africanus]|uniref:Kinetoplast-associated protein-like protein n=1 Tax=Volvox africanus TaxID=51714 RepID=A0ABQ5S4B9_9CHLO|nr:hypothetical protein VaNZ11_007621 [Volvox africanus]
MMTQPALSSWPCSVAGERPPTYGPSFPLLPPRQHRTAIMCRAHHLIAGASSSIFSSSPSISHMTTAGSSCSLGSSRPAAAPGSRPGAAFISTLRPLRGSPAKAKAASDARDGSGCDVDNTTGAIGTTVSPLHHKGQHARDRDTRNTADLSGEKLGKPSTSLRVTEGFEGVEALPRETTTAAASGSGAAATAAEGSSHATTAQSEYVEEYETVYETESEDHGSSGNRLLSGTAIAESKAEAAKETEVPILGVGSTLAEAEATAGAAAFGGLHTAAARYQTVTALQATSPPLASLPMGGHADVTASLAGTTAGGWALAAALLLAIRMSRQEADAERLDLQALQALQTEGRQRDSELRARRNAFLEQERRRLEDEAARRVAEAKARQEEETRAAAERQRQWQEEAAREAQRMQEAAAAARRVYEEREARLAEELAARAEVERRLREEAEARRREEAETRRRAEVEAAQRVAEQRAAAAAAEVARRAAEEAARREAERLLKLSSTWYTLAFRGHVAGRPAPPGSTVPLKLSGSAGAAAAMLRGPPAARIVLECSFEVSHIARTAPTITAVLDGVAAQDAAAVAAAVAAAEAAAAAAAATKVVPAAELPADDDSATGMGVGMAAAAPAISAASGRPYESTAAAVEGAAELAGTAAAPLGALMSSPSWLGNLRLDPSPRETLVRWIAGGAEEREDREGRGAAAAEATVGGPAPITGAAAGAGTAAGAAAVPDVQSLADAELRHWARMAHLQLLSSGRQIICQLAPLLGPGEQLEQELQCRISRQVPPPAVPAAVTTAAATDSAAAAVALQAVAPSLRRAAAAVAAGQLQRAVEIINMVIAREEAAAAAGRDGAANGAALPPLAVAALVYGELMESAGYQAAAAAAEPSVTTSAFLKRTEEAANNQNAGESASNVVDATAAAAAAAAGGSLERLARYQLSERAKKAPLDSLTVTAQFLRAVLPGGPGHPVVCILDKLAEANMSLATRQATQIRQQRAALEAQAAAVLEEQRGGGSPGSGTGTGGALVVGPGGAADARGSLVPVPERLWATRNVAKNLMRFGEPLQVGEAVNMLEESVSLARRHYGERHPCQLAVLLDYLDALAAEAAIQAKVAAQQAPANGLAGQPQPQSGTAAGTPSRQYRAAEELLEVVQALCERYQANRDPLSCVLLLEAALVVVSPLLRPTGRGTSGGRSSSVNGRGSASLAAASELAGKLMYSLKPPEARTVMTIRREGQLPSLMRRLARDFTEELAAHGKKRNRWVDAFNTGSPLTPLRP